MMQKKTKLTKRFGMIIGKTQKNLWKVSGGLYLIGKKVQKFLRDYGGKKCLRMTTRWFENYFVMLLFTVPILHEVIYLSKYIQTG